MIVINKNSYTKIYWKIFRGENKVSEDFHSINTELKVFLVGPCDKRLITYSINRSINPGYDVVEIDVHPNTLSEGVYDLRAIWWKNKGRDLMTSNRCGIFGITDSVEEAPIEDLVEIKIASYTESFGRDGMSAYEAAVMYNLHLGITSEREWVMQETIRIENEDTRKDAEEGRIAAEISRKNNESSRVSAEGARERKEHIRESNELARISNESSRQSAEGLRKSNEENREASEQERCINERGRIQSEKARMSAESSRVASEGSREAAESKRKEAESSRETAEAQRVEDESVRVEAESVRVEAEKGRAAAEAARQTTFDTNEESRQSTFDTNEEERQSVFNANEEKREEAEALREERIDEAIASIANKVDRDDYAPGLTAGFADNLVGRGEATDETIGFRPSGGDTSIEDGTARIERLKGNTVVWNQRVNSSSNTSTSSNGVTFTKNTDGSFSVMTDDGGATADAFIQLGRGISVTAEHKYLLYGAAQGGSPTTYCAYSTVAVECFDYGNGKMATAKDGYAFLVIMIKKGCIISSPKIFALKFIDLTKMFGAGNEPTTIEEFNARKPLGIDEYAYNEGELISTTADEIKSVGFNAWDEEWINGYYTKNGFTENPNYVAMKNPIKVIAGQKYYFSHKVGYSAIFLVTHYDKYDNYIDVPNIDTNGRVTLGNYSEYIIPDGVHYIRVFMSNAYGTTYNHDICIHLVHTGYRNGEYEPYEEFRRSLPISEIKDSEGNALFPNGLLSAGSVYDEITATKAIKRIGMVDMGSLEWNASNSRFNSLVKVGKDVQQSNNVICYLYTNDVGAANRIVDKAVCIANGGYVYVYDTSYTDAAAFKAAMSGVMLYYELAEPIEVDLPEPINMDYEVSDFGTEEAISEAPTAPIKADIVYQFNAVDRIRENSLSIEDLIKRVVALETQNAALVQQLNSTDNEQTE